MHAIVGCVTRNIARPHKIRAWEMGAHENCHAIPKTMRVSSLCEYINNLVVHINTPNKNKTSSNTFF